MQNYWAIAIGINQYQSLQPLMYAQWDAYNLQQYLQSSANFSREKCWLLTDASAPIAGHATLPTRENIQHHIVELCQRQVAANEILWVFFSGYGVHADGRDYFLPLDGDPNRPIATGIPISELFATLKTAPTSNIILLLDMKQGGGASSAQSNHLGQHTLALAREHNLATILSCQPGQFSHETLALRQGLFTAALLEGLQHYGCITLEHLVQHLSNRLPELSEQHWRPRQEPGVIVPGELRYQLILPGKETIVGEEVVLTEPDTVLETAPDAAPQPPGLPGPSAPPSINGPQAPLQDSDQSELSSEDEETFWRNLLRWGGLLLALLLTGVLVRNWSAFRGEPTAPLPDNASLGTGRLSPNVTRPPESTDNNESNSSESAVSSPLTFDAESSDTLFESPIDGAQQAIAAGLPLEALQWLDQVPANEQTDIYANLRANAEQLNNQVAQTNQAILNEALASMNRARQETPVNQASDFHRAIVQASRIQPGQPLYEETQQYIQRWGRVILDLAQARAGTGSYEDAIAAAQLIPQNQPELYSVAEQLIAQWQQNITQTSTSQDVIEQANRLIQPGQASSYNDAINQLRSIQPGQLGYEDARGQMNQWGQEILQIAYDRAAIGDAYGAINAAALVPEDAEVYLEAREAIEGWRIEIRGN